MSLIEVKEVKKVYDQRVHALKGVSFEVKAGEFLVIIGLSGSGKSTLLRCMNRLHDPTSGQIYFDGQELTALRGSQLRQARAKIGMIFQHFNLIPRQSVLTNVLAGTLGHNHPAQSFFYHFPKSAREAAMEKIRIVGLEGKESQRADRLSGGQQQRVAIARALMQSPKLMLADEPVASLDPATSHSVMQYLEKINRELGVTVICNLHFLSLVRQYASRVIALKDGKMVFEGSPDQITDQWFKTIYGDDAREVTIN